MSKLPDSKEILSTKQFKTVIESSDDSQNTKNIKRLINLYLVNMNKLPDNMIPELEVRFGTKKIQPLTKIDFYNVINVLLHYNFKSENENYILKVISDNESSQIRTQINGLPNIQHYCKYNNINNILDSTNLQFIEKDYYIDNQNKIYPLDIDDFNFRLSYQIEKHYQINDSIIQNIITKWTSTKKIFRYIKRFEFTNPDFPFLIHCSIVKTSRMNNGKLIPQFNIKDSNVFDSIEHYEIEIEFNNPNIGINTQYDTGIKLYKSLKQVIKYILIGIQQTNFPITISQQKLVINNYLKIIKNKEYDATKKILTSDFIGPSSLTLQMINLINTKDINDTNKNIPNIRTNYCVTDKADGFRKLLFINDDGKIYLINTSMNVEFTGSYTNNKDIFNTIIDGEHILHNKKGQFINLFASFDVYYINNKNVTSLPFINIDKETSDTKKDDSRLVILKSIIKILDKTISSIIPSSKSSITITNKKFYANNVFSASNIILNNHKEGLIEYPIDGLIFTPTNTAVASNKSGIIAPNFKTTWKESFKWKPPEYNTIDFLIKIQKNDFGSNKVSYIHNQGTNLTSNNNYLKYYTLILHVGFDEKKHGYINPCNDIINDNITKNSDYKYNNYKPARFYPTNPSDENAAICNIIGVSDESDNLKIYTLEGEEIEDNTIVEFKYDTTKNQFWKWIPLRVRYDKTSELRNGGKNFGNAYHVANSNWQSIHNPITDKIITSGDNVQLQNSDDDVYYNKVNSKSETRALRDFHNLFVKNVLIEYISNKGTTLIDYACGKAGDLPKWINSNLTFVLGIDLNKDNIENRLDGACARYLNYYKKYDSIPNALFINGNSSLNIKSGEAFNNDKNKQIIKAIFGEGNKNELLLGKRVYNNYGICKDGFNISSIQFALHYMFENETILHQFLKNISQCTSLDGYLIGTCYDGHKVFKLLNDTTINNSITLFKNDNKIWEITKKYSYSQFNDDETSIGYAIDVFQESINKTFREYLVNFNYLKRLLENYGFVPLSDNELKSFNFDNSIGDFNDLYNKMQSICTMDKTFVNKIGNALNMSDQEKQISFLNKYFIFKKVRNITSDEIYDSSLKIDKQLNITEDFNKIDKTIQDIQKNSIIEKQEENLNTLKNKISIEEKLKIAEQKKLQKDLAKHKLKEQKELEKQKLKQQKELEKQKLKEQKELEKLKLKEQKKLDKKTKTSLQNTII